MDYTAYTVDEDMTLQKFQYGHTGPTDVLTMSIITYKDGKQVELPFMIGHRMNTMGLLTIPSPINLKKEESIVIPESMVFEIVYKEELK